jgi:hypothetical protein
MWTDKLLSYKHYHDVCKVQGMQCRTLRASNVDVADVSTGGACSASGKVMSSKMPNKPCPFILHLAFRHRHGVTDWWIKTTARRMLWKCFCVCVSDLTELAWSPVTSTYSTLIPNRGGGEYKHHHYALYFWAGKLFVSLTQETPNS